MNGTTGSKHQIPGPGYFANMGESVQFDMRLVAFHRLIDPSKPDGEIVDGRRRGNLVTLWIQTDEKLSEGLAECGVDITMEEAHELGRFLLSLERTDLAAAGES